MSIQELKVCRRCHLELPIDSFSITDKQYGYRRGWCKACEAIRVREYYAGNPDYRAKVKANAERWFKESPKAPAVRRRALLKHKYGLTETQFKQMVAAQDGKCALCGGTEHGRTGESGRYDGSRKWLVSSWIVDHDHTTGQVRGLLCHKCNIALGQYEWLMQTIGEAAVHSYLTRPSPVPPQPTIGEVFVPRFVAELPPPRPKAREVQCLVPGCEKNGQKRGYCGLHYARLMRTGDPGPAAHLPHAASKLTDDHVRAIRASDERNTVLAERYGTSQATISMIRNHRIWTHVT